MPFFRKKPVVVEAIQFDGDNASDIAEWATRVSSGTARPVVMEVDGFTDEVIQIDTPEGTIRGVADDWIIRGVAGELYPCKPGIFAAIYEPVVGPGSESGFREHDEPLAGKGEVSASVASSRDSRAADSTESARG